MAHITDRPLAAKGFTSYRYQGNYGWIMIGAKDKIEALSEAARSMRFDKPVLAKLQVWDGVKYRTVKAADK